MKLVLEKVILLDGRIIYKLWRCGEASNDLADSSKKEGVIGNEKQENSKKVEALPLASEKLEDERKNPPSKLKKINLAVNWEEKVTFVAETLEEDFELALVACLKSMKMCLLGLIKICQG